MIEFDEEKCIRCGACLYTCPKRLFTLEEGKVVFQSFGDCITCNACEASCPTGAVRVR